MNRERIKNIILILIVIVLFGIVARYDTYTYTSDVDIKEAQQTAIENINSKAK